MSGSETRPQLSPWAHTEGIGAGFVDTHRPALTSGPTSGQETSGEEPMTDAPRIPREPPISPHLMTGGLGSPLLWRWHITMWTSILHRATGVALYVGALIAAAWAIALAQGPERYAEFKQLLFLRCTAGADMDLVRLAQLHALIDPFFDFVGHPCELF